MEGAETRQIYLDESVTGALSMGHVASDFEVLLERLYPGKKPKCSAEDLQKIFDSDRDFICFVVVEGCVVSTAHATLIEVPGARNAVINNVITAAEAGGQGHGRAAMEALIAAIAERWGGQGDLNIMLTNNPQKGNAGFYEALGMVKVPTQLWGLPHRV